MLGWPLVIAAAFFACATLIVLSGEGRLHYFEGQKLSQPVFARVKVEVENSGKTQIARRNAEQSVPNYFKLNQALIDLISAEVRDLHAAVKSAESFEVFQESEATRWTLDKDAFDALKRMTDEAGSERFKHIVDKLAERLAKVDMIKSAAVDREPRSRASHVVMVRKNGEQESVPKENLRYAANAEQVERTAREHVRFVVSPELEEVLVAIIKRAIMPSEGEVQPIYEFDLALTKSRVEDKLASFVPVKDVYYPGDVLVPTGTLQPAELGLLEAEHNEYLKQRVTNPELLREWRLRQLGLIGIVFMVTVGMSLYTYLCQRRIARKTARAFALALLMLVMLFIDRTVLVGMNASPMWSVASITMTAAILTIAYSQIFAIGMTTGLALLTIPTLGAPFSIALVLLTVASVTVLLLREIRTRLKIVEVGVIVALAAAISAAFVSLAHGEAVIANMFVASVAALAGISIVMVLMPVIEKAFMITTSLTLLEWADTNNPLLRQLIEKAPGTWQHSHLLGSMAEKAAAEIGANGLLVRVGAYYHDIGKICKPNYFVENQQARINAHRGLAPTMSLLVILAHVKDGLALARENRLPPVLHQFITQHHGTTIVRYFHAKATEEARAAGQGAREPSESEFRYPGPKPQSREAAILMLCDGVEGAVRALQDPTPGRIENVVSEITMARLMDGQFDDCDITLKELSRVEQSLIKSLCAIHHGRIAYPKSGESTSQPQVRTA